jgi:hypothetical protein
MAFLNALVKENIYMKEPKGFETKNDDPHTQYLCKLNKAIYGIKQAPHEWYNEINEKITILKFKRCMSDQCVYVKQSKTGKMIILTLFVDDIVAAYHIDDEEEFLQDKKYLMSKYEMKDLGDVNWILGMQVKRERKNKILIINQKLYCEKMVETYKMNECKSSSTPRDSSMKLSKDDSPQNEKEKEDMKNVPYQQLVGSLLYAAIHTRPDINFAVNLVSRFNQNPGVKHWIATKKILRYIKDTTNIGLLYDGNKVDKNNNKNKVENENENNKIINFHLTAYCDSDWAGDEEDRKSVTGNIIKLNDCIVSWNSIKQRTVALSSAEAEYISLSETVQELKWIQNLMYEVLFNCSYEKIQTKLENNNNNNNNKINNNETTNTEISTNENKNEIKYEIDTTVLCDNQSAIKLSENELHHKRTKHIDIRYHFVRQNIKEKNIKVKWIQTENQLADILTKGLGKNIFTKLRNEIHHIKDD